MMRELRKRHLQVWVACAFLLPSAIVIARLAIPKAKTQSTLQPTQIAAFPILVSKISRDDYDINFRKNNNNEFQLEWSNKKILIVPTATIYISNLDDTSIQRAELIGRIEARGTYYFPFKNEFATESAKRQFIVYDFIHDQIIDKIKF